MVFVAAERGRVATAWGGVILYNRPIREAQVVSQGASDIFALNEALQWAMKELSRLPPEKVTIHCANKELIKYGACAEY